MCVFGNEFYTFYGIKQEYIEIEFSNLPSNYGKTISFLLADSSNEE